MLVARDLVKEYRGVEAVRGVSLTLKPGCVLGLVGANGAGKSTTIKMLTGLVEPTSGVAELDGAPTTLPDVRRRIGYLPEDSPLYEDLTPYALLTFFGGLYGVAKRVARTRADDLLDRLGLESSARERPIGTLSKGMRRKVAIARAVLHGPDHLILDEPTSGLDPKTVREMGDFFLELRDEGRAILLSAHNLPQVEEVCDEILIMDGGRMAAHGTLEELRAAWGQRAYRVRATTPLPGGTLHGSMYQADYGDWDEAEAALTVVRAEGGTVLEVEAVPPRLDQILAAATGA